MSYKTKHFNIINEWDKLKESIIVNITHVMNNSDVDGKTLEVMLSLVDNAVIRNRRNDGRKKGKDN